MNYIKEYSEFIPVNDSAEPIIDRFYSIPDEIINNVKDVLDDIDIDYTMKVWDYRHFEIHIRSSSNKEFAKPFHELENSLRNGRGLQKDKSVDLGWFWNLVGLSKKTKESIKKILSPSTHRDDRRSAKINEDDLRRSFGNENKIISRICKLSGFTFTSFECSSYDVDSPFCVVSLNFFLKDI